MATLTTQLFDGYKWLNEEASDPRTETWFLMSSPWPGLGILVFYLYFVLNLGPEAMKNRKPFKMDGLIMLYNLVQIIACTYVFISASLIWVQKYKFLCEPIDFSRSDDGMFVAGMYHFYFMLKIADLLDTVFFVLRKKNNQITFLHVYHHTGMVMLTWSATKWLPGGHGSFLGLLNSFVHSVMYSYYFLTVYKPELKQSIWWKKYITQLQIYQFLALVLHFGALVVIPNCGYPRWPAAVFLPQNLFMLYLFCDFYRKTYLLKPKSMANGNSKQKEDCLNNNIEKRKIE